MTVITADRDGAPLVVLALRMYYCWSGVWSPGCRSSFNGGEPWQIGNSVSLALHITPRAINTLFSHRELLRFVPNDFQLALGICSLRRTVHRA